MYNPRLATRYAKSLIDLSLERGELETTHKDLLYLQSVTQSNRDFVAVLRSPVISADKKLAILEAVTAGHTGELTTSFCRLLIKKGREANLPEIIRAFIDQYKKYRQIFSVKLTTAVPVTDTVKEEIMNKLRQQSDMKNIELTAEVDESLIGGFVLQIGDKLVDASIAYDLNNVRKQFLNNDFIYKIR